MPELGFLATSFGAWGAALLSLIGLFLRLFWGVNKDEGRGRWVAWLRHDTFARRYREILNAGLDRIDRLLSPDFTQIRTDHVPNRKTEPARAWSAPLLDLCLLLAVAYPVLAVYVDWMIRGETIEVASLPAGTADWLRWFATAGVVTAVLPGAFARWGRFSRGLHFISLGFAGLFASAFAVSLIVIIGLGGADSLGGAVFGLAEGATAVLIAVTAALAVTAGEEFGDAVLRVGSIGSVVVFFTGVAITFAIALAVAGAVAITIAGALSAIQDWMGRRIGRPAVALACFSALLFAALWGIIALQEGAGRGPEFLTFFLFLGYFPLLNAWADFASIGLTRWRLRIGVQHNLVANAILDAVAAVLILIALAFAMVATMYLLRTADGVPLYDAAALLADLRDRRENYWWLAFMLFSTLLPTLAHLAIGAFALFTLASGWLGRPIAAGLMKGDSPEGRIASLALSIAAALALWLPCLLLWLGLKHGGAPLFDALLWSCERFLALLQASFPLRAAG